MRFCLRTVMICFFLCLTTHVLSAPSFIQDNDQWYLIDNNLKLKILSKPEFIGRGAQAHVYKILINFSNGPRWVALKTVEEDTHVESLQNELNMLQYIHANAPTNVSQAVVYPEFAHLATIPSGFLNSRSHVAMILEFLDGGFLEAFFREGLDQILLEQLGQNVNESLFQLALTVLTFLEWSDVNHILHCDLKPQNILIQNTPKGRKFKIVDFGMACRSPIKECSEQQCIFDYAATIDRPGTGTSRYTHHSIKMVRGNSLPTYEACEGTDPYALAIILYEAIFNAPYWPTLMGVNPFAQMLYAVANGQKRAKEVTKEIDDKLNELKNHVEKSSENDQASILQEPEYNIARLKLMLLIRYILNNDINGQGAKLYLDSLRDSTQQDLLSENTLDEPDPYITFACSISRFNSIRNSIRYAVARIKKNRKATDNKQNEFITPRERDIPKIINWTDGDQAQQDTADQRYMDKLESSERTKFAQQASAHKTTKKTLSLPNTEPTSRMVLPMSERVILPLIPIGGSRLVFP